MKVALEKERNVANFSAFRNAEVMQSKLLHKLQLSHQKREKDGERSRLNTYSASSRSLITLRSEINSIALWVVSLEFGNTQYTQNIFTQCSANCQQHVAFQLINLCRPLKMRTSSG